MRKTSKLTSAPLTTISRILKRYKTTGENERLRGSGRRKAWVIMKNIYKK
jgi:hypothetical protein